MTDSFWTSQPEEMKGSSPKVVEVEDE